MTVSQPHHPTLTRRCAHPHCPAEHNSGRSPADRVTDAMAAGAAAGLAALNSGDCRDGACPDHQPHEQGGGAMNDK
jgi:hypothetical protein